MPEKGDKVRSIHWALKLLLTMLVGGLFAISIGFLPTDALAGITPAVAWTLYLAILVLLTTIFAAGLYLRDRCTWRRSALMGVMVGVVASILITTAGSLAVVLFDWLFSLIRLG